MNGVLFSLPSNFAYLGRKEQNTPVQESMTNILRKESIHVQDVILLSIDQPPNSTPVVDGLLSMRDFLEPLIALLTLIEVGLRLRVQRVADILVMSLKAKDFQHLQTSATVSTASL
ncbi:Argininosuccinate lyase [Bienertia sinuspersici]